MISFSVFFRSLWSFSLFVLLFIQKESRRTFYSSLRYFFCTHAGMIYLYTQARTTQHTHDKNENGFVSDFEWNTQSNRISMKLPRFSVINKHIHIYIFNRFSSLKPMLLWINFPRIFLNIKQTRKHLKCDSNWKEWEILFKNRNFFTRNWLKVVFLN